MQCYKKEYSKPLKRTSLKKTPISIKKATKKRIQQYAEYKKLRAKYLEANSICEIQSNGCTYMATELHHKGGRENDRLLDVDYYCATCHHCHSQSTVNSAQSIKDGHSVSRHKKTT